ncbi:hypothetical protein AAHA92_17867 [Salvia divinorum]|uniref:Uncharacterized protein n=1 Tax=Salvia divinorum TaxID=28513 RepID=A0ABD1H075_SALDI
MILLPHSLSIQIRARPKSPPSSVKFLSLFPLGHCPLSVSLSRIAASPRSERSAAAVTVRIASPAAECPPESWFRGPPIRCQLSPVDLQYAPQTYRRFHLNIAPSLPGVAHYRRQYTNCRSAAPKKWTHVTNRNGKRVGES